MGRSSQNGLCWIIIAWDAGAPRSPFLVSPPLSRLSVLALVQHCLTVVFREAPLHRAYDMGCNTWLCDLASRTDRHSSWISGLSLTSFASAMPLFCAAVGFPMLLRLPR